MITTIGLGFVGLTTALGFAKKGFKTYGIDLDESKLQSFREKKVPFFEPHMDDVLKEQLHQNFLIDQDYNQAIKDSKVIFICVGTPANPDGSADLTYIKKAIEQIAAVEFDDDKVIVIKSTVPPSSVLKQLEPHAAQQNQGKSRKIAVASNPEFLREGYSWEDFMDPDRVVIGVNETWAHTILDDIYKPFGAPVHYVSTNTAEYIKYLSNTLLSTLISFSNEMAMIGDAIGDVDVAKAFRILHEDKRWSGTPANMASYVFPGCGYGGYCLPKDTQAINDIAAKNGVEAKVLQSNLETNEKIKIHSVQKVVDGQSKEDTIGVLGLSFKSGSDDIRLSPSHDIIKGLLDNGFKKLVVFDPMANEIFDRTYNLPLTYANSVEEVVDKSDAVLITTAWKDFKPYEKMIKSKKLYDLRYMFS